MNSVSFNSYCNTAQTEQRCTVVLLYTLCQMDPNLRYNIRKETKTVWILPHLIGFNTWIYGLMRFHKELSDTTYNFLGDFLYFMKKKRVSLPNYIVK